MYQVVPTRSSARIRVSHLGRTVVGSFTVRRGEVTVRDVTAPVLFELETLPDGQIRATTQLDRTLFGIRAPRAVIGRYVDVELIATLSTARP